MPRGLGRVFMVAIWGIAFLVLMGQAVIHGALGGNEDDARQINLAGRQRMLCLLMSVQAQELAAEPWLGDSQARELARGLAEWEAVHDGLLKGDRDLGLKALASPEARQRLQALDPERRGVSWAVKGLLQARQAGARPAELQDWAAQVASDASGYRTGMDALVGLLEKASHDSLRARERLQWGLTALVLLALALVGRFVYRPMARRLARYMEFLGKAAQRFEELSLTDQLTGLANRRQWDQALAHEWARAARSREPLTVIMLDIDHFKEYNDTHGHQAGDQALREVAKVLAASARRPADLTARYGGEEMAALLPDTGLRGGLALAERLRQRVQELGLAHPASPVGPVLTVSLGVAEAGPSQGGDPLDLVRAADQALYLAKRQGRNRVQARSTLAGLPEGGQPAPGAPGPTQPLGLVP